MSGLVNKVKEALHSDKSDKHASHHDTTTGTHTTGTHTTGTHTTGTHTTGTHTAGTHMTGAHTTGTHHTTGAGLDNRGVHGPASGTDGPHNSNLMNKADPRVDSDRDHSHNMGVNSAGNARTDNAHTGVGVGGMHSAGNPTTGGLHGTTGAHHTTGASGLHGTTGTSGLHATTGTTGVHGTHGSAAGAGLDNRGVHGPASGTDGPHNSNLMNKADPRVDSDRDHSHNMGANSAGNARTDNLHSGAGVGGMHSAPGAHHTAGHHTTGVHGTTGTHGTTGVHDTTGVHGTTGAYNASGPGPAPGTAGPHKSDILNKADPRVDSNLDGSKTVGGDKTFAQTNMAHKDPTDAAQVPPSVMQKVKGAPEVHHDDPRHSTERRHGSISDQAHGHGL